MIVRKFQVALLLVLRSSWSHAALGRNVKHGCHQGHNQTKLALACPGVTRRGTVSPICKAYATEVTDEQGNLPISRLLCHPGTTP